MCQFEIDIRVIPLLLRIEILVILLKSIDILSIIWGRVLHPPLSLSLSYLRFSLSLSHFSSFIYPLSTSIPLPLNSHFISSLSFSFISMSISNHISHSFSIFSYLCFSHLLSSHLTRFSHSVHPYLPLSFYVSRFLRLNPSLSIFPLISFPASISIIFKIFHAFFPKLHSIVYSSTHYLPLFRLFPYFSSSLRSRLFDFHG